MTAPYPIVFEPMLLNKVWGGDSLSRVGKPVPPGSTIGESWEVADLASTSASGAGGGSAQSKILHGALAGRTLHDAMRTWGTAMLGDASGAGEANAHFPLLIKYLDARENLSVQVHPSIAYAKQHSGAHIKTECWYILHAQPGAVIYKGVKPGVTREMFAHALHNRQSVVPMLEAVPAMQGDCHLLPSGTVHALGAGVLAAEVQTPSDTTFRVDDWGRAGRELHVEQALACIMWERARDATRLVAGQRVSRLVTTGYFEVDEARIAMHEHWACDEAFSRSAPLVLMILAGAGVLRAKGCDAVPLRAGITALVPASLAHTCTIEASEAVTVLRAAPR
jgi:mannose-6-phosphate isomerase